MGLNPHALKLDFSAFTNSRREAKSSSGSRDGRRTSSGGTIGQDDDPFAPKKRHTSFSSSVTSSSSHNTASTHRTAPYAVPESRAPSWVNRQKQPSNTVASLYPAQNTTFKPKSANWGDVIDLTGEDGHHDDRNRNLAAPITMEYRNIRNATNPTATATFPSRPRPSADPLLDTWSSEKLTTWNAAKASSATAGVSTSYHNSSASYLNGQSQHYTQILHKTAAQIKTKVLKSSNSSASYPSSSFQSSSSYSSSVANDTKEDSSFSSSVSLTREQEAVINIVMEQRQSVFFTGSAGTGKSVLLRELIKRLRTKYRKDEVAITASTGIAACNISGTTLHSFAGVGIAQGSILQLVATIRKNQRAVTRWMRAKVLIIDEISMVEPDFFDKLEGIARDLRGGSARFGGIQLVICGDFLQLPPVSPHQSETRFCFEAKTWQACVSRTIVLKTVFRQKDQTFVDILNEMRVGRMSDKSMFILSNLSRDPAYKDDIAPTQLFPVRTQVDAANREFLSRLPGEMKSYRARDNVKTEWDAKKLKDSLIAMEVLELKIGAQVMLIKNLEDNLVNGSLGRVTGFTDSGLPIVDFNGQTYEVERQEWTLDVPGRGTVATRQQIPLILSYAMSIHKSQGQTLERVKVDLGRIFEKGQAYVALSRAVSLDGLQVLNFNADKVKPHPKVIEFHRSLETSRPI